MDDDELKIGPSCFIDTHWSARVCAAPHVYRLYRSVGHSRLYAAWRTVLAVLNNEPESDDDGVTISIDH